MRLEIIDNTQPPEKEDWRSDGSLDVVSVWRTIQGEGPFAGTPAVFVRLAGCNLMCPRCDTDYTTSRQRVPVQMLARGVEQHAEFNVSSKPTSLVVVTGGEPFRQNISPLVEYLIFRGFRVQVETNGTIGPDKQSMEPFFMGAIFIVCSPKTPKIHPDLLQYIHAYKYILRAGCVDSKDGLPTSALGMSQPPARPHRGFRNDVFVQPLDEHVEANNKANLIACVNSCMKFGYRLSIQMHKEAGLP